MKSLVRSLVLLLWSSVIFSSVHAQLEELEYAAVRGWYNNCTSTGAVPCQTLEEFYTIPLYLDYETCYSNPNMNQVSVTFLGRDANTNPVFYNLIFTSPQGMAEFSPTNCDSRGACVCNSPSELGGLRAAILEDPTMQCQAFAGMYQCTVVPYDKKATACLVPEMANLGSNGQEELVCSMVADISLVPPETLPATNPPTEADGAGTTAVPDNQGPTNVVIPDKAHDAYCTAIVGWYNGCLRDDSNDLMECNGTVTSTTDPLFIDFDTCYMNPAEEDAVSMYGKDANGLVSGYHIIFLNDNGAATYRPTECQDNGACVCPASLVALKTQFLAAGTCDGTADYLCAAESFRGDTEQCYIPNSFELPATTSFVCTMSAQTQQFTPCNNVPPVTDVPTNPPTVKADVETAAPDDDGPINDPNVVIPDNAHDAYCTAIVGWHNGCTETPNGVDFVECNETVTSLATDPLFIDFETCYINPAIGDSSVSMYGKDVNGFVTGYHIIFLIENGAVAYRPMECQANGACVCSAPLVELKKQFLAAGTCDITADYLCTAQTFEGDTEDCYVPTFAELPNNSADNSFVCTMAAQVQQFGPCDKAAPPKGTENTTTPTNAPTVVDATSVPDDSTSVAIPDNAHDAYCTAIVGWHNGCTETPDGDDFVECDGSVTSLATDPLFIDFETCYINPAIGDGAVSMYGKDANGIVTGYHIIFLIENGAVAYRPMECQDNGACVCSAPLVEMKKKFLASGTCDITADYLCTAQSFEGDTEDCYIPTFAELPNSADNAFVCTMAAQVQQFGPCNVQSPTTSPSLSVAPSRDMSQPVVTLPTNVHDIPATAVDLGFTAITGWWNKCSAGEGETDKCGGATQQRFEHPVYLNLDTCYSNPNAFFRSVSFFHKTTDNKVYSYHLLFENDASWATFKPSDCTNRGECTCETSPQLQAVREALVQNPTCPVDGVEGYTCTREEFSSFNADCYVPAQQVFVSSGTSVCAMAASLEQIVPTSDFVDDGEDPGEAEFPKEGEGGVGDTANSESSNPSSSGSNNDGIEWWAILLIVVMVMCVASVVTLYVVRRRRYSGNVGGADDEDVWVRTDHQRDSRFTRRPLNTDDAGDGVWKKEGTNIHDLKFTVT